MLKFQSTSDGAKTTNDGCSKQGGLVRVPLSVFFIVSTHEADC